MVPVLKTGVGATPPGVQIPPLPPKTKPAMAYNRWKDRSIGRAANY
jgi:hypothetical protein